VIIASFDPSGTEYLAKTGTAGCPMKLCYQLELVNGGKLRKIKKRAWREL
jgi:hypothetical protein